MGTKRKDSDSLISLLGDIRNGGMRDTQYIERLLIRLTGIEGSWSEDQCKRFYEALLRKYIKYEKHLDLMLAVSGIDERYGGCLVSAGKRRENYYDHLMMDVPTEEWGNPDSLRKTEEKHCLEHIAKELEKVIEKGDGAKLVEQLISGEGDIKNTEEKINDFNQQYPSTHESAEYNIDNPNFRGTIHTVNVAIGNGNQINSEETNTKIDNGNKISITAKGKIKITKKKVVIFVLLALFIVGVRCYNLSLSSPPLPTDKAAVNLRTCIQPNKYVLLPSF